MSLPLQSKLPQRLERLGELAYNLWSSWHPRARELFRALDPPSWRLCGHDPVRELREIAPERVQAAAADPAFLAVYDSVLSAFDADMEARDSWFAATHPGLLRDPIAYFSMEFALHNSLPIYAGGLGVLAGDICKEASDLGLPLVGVGFMYPQGYFHQHISPEGWQEEIYRQLNFDELPISPVPPPEGPRPLVQIALDNRTISVGVWQVHVGRTTLYLLDAVIEGGAAQDQRLSARLYTADPQVRLQQEIMLGIGGVRVLRALGITPSLWHANEGHTAFMMLERIREEVEKGVPFAEAVRRVRATTIFTTHTPVPAGSDIFPPELVERYLHSYRESLGIDRETFLNLGREEAGKGDFNMTVLGLTLADHRTAVSQLHGEVARRMWRTLWPSVPENEVPISHVTNGIHVPTWIAPEMGLLYEKYLGPEAVRRPDEAALWERVREIPDEEIWAVRQFLKCRLLGAIRERAQGGWMEGRGRAEQVLAMGALLDPEVLTIGFVRRFTEYKRPTLILRDIQRLKRILTDQRHPVQIIFAGKSHPTDLPAKDLLHHVYTLALDQEVLGRVAFVEDYDMHMARYLVHGADVWLNTPRRLREACGTSGMKAALNGGLHLSVPDGWWREGSTGVNGWVIGPREEFPSPESEDEADALALYRLLEEEIVPLYYDRDRRGVPHGWLKIVKEAICSTAPHFSARRMLKEYIERLYLTALKSL